MAIVLPQGLLNNTNTEDIRRWLFEETRILAVVGRHGNTFKPHTGTKTSVLFLQKYTEEEKQKIQQLKMKYEAEWDNFINKLKSQFSDIKWDSQIDEEKIPEDLKTFMDSYFETQEEIEIPEEEKIEIEEGQKKPLGMLIQELQEFKEALLDKEKELEKVPESKKREIKRQIRTLKTKIKKLEKEIFQRTLAGQIYLTLNEEKITQSFKKFWLDGKVIKEMDYPIFMAVNQKPVKDNSGEYRYQKDEKGDYILDENEHPIIEHDLDEIAKAFIKFAKEQGFYFWKR